jgi:membrane fusion protein, multidrug efflux system
MRRGLLITGAAVVILGGAGAGVLLTRGSTGKISPTAPGLPPATAKITRTTLVETKTVSGTLGYGNPAPIGAAASGTITWIAPVGSTVRRNEPLFKIDDRPVVALYGSLPLYRALRVGAIGRDVRQLERNLAVLGFAGFTVDDTYGVATAAAVRAWQAKLGVPQTGAVEPGQVVFARGPVRIAEHVARVGDRAEGGSVLSDTGARRRVTVELEVADAALAVRGRTVTVHVPGQAPVNGRISRVGAVATAKGTGAAGPGGGAGTDTPGSAASAARIEVTVTIADQRALGPLDAAPVDVDFVSTRRKDVLAVPVAALLARPQGGFGVQVVDGTTTRIVAVKSGLFAAGRVEVSGEGITQGVRVGVPR